MAACSPCSGEAVRARVLQQWSFLPVLIIALLLLRMSGGGWLEDLYEALLAPTELSGLVKARARAWADGADAPLSGQHTRWWTCCDRYPSSPLMHHTDESGSAASNRGRSVLLPYGNLLQRLCRGGRLLAPE